MRCGSRSTRMRPDHQRKYRAALYGCVTVEGSGASQLPSSGLVSLAPSRSTLDPTDVSVLSPKALTLSSGAGIRSAASGAAVA